MSGTAEGYRRASCVNLSDFEMFSILFVFSDIPEKSITDTAFENDD